MSIRLPKIFLDSGDPEETKKAKGILGFLDGQTTNPSLVAKHPEAQKYISAGKKFTESELLKFYKEVVAEIGKEISGPISVEVYADWETKAETMLVQARDMFTWGHNIQLKFPTIPEGLKAANQFVKEGGRVNMTLVFTEEQAAAVYVTTATGGGGGRGPDSAQTLASTGGRETDDRTRRNDVHFVSPFLGRWYDRGYNGLDLIKNVIKMYKKFNKQTNEKKHHVQVLASSIRDMDQFYGSIALGSDILTVPIKVLYSWVQDGKSLPDQNFHAPQTGVKPIVYKDLPLRNNFEEYEVGRVEGDLLDEGIKRFAADWKSLFA